MNGTVPANGSSARGSEVVLSPEQEDVLYRVDRKENVFFTGPAGKSVLLRAIIKKLRPNPLVVNGIAVTASTGIAGLNIGGTTLHSFAGIGLGKERAEVLARKIKKSTKLSQRWRTTRVLIIDEISMIDAVLFDKLEEIARIIRRNDETFGGIQVSAVLTCTLHISLFWKLI
ncbi:PIF1-like helicase-domain-containing protein [Pholiota molesta]|nr:PIF1-like helicase-domain-containing protein [Pholiota molesta]